MRVCYEDRFEGLVPEPAFPLPVGRFRAPKTLPKWWEPFLDFAEAYFKLTPEELEAGKGVLPRRFSVASPKNPFVSGVRARVVVSMNFFAQWSLEKDDPVAFPRGVKVLQDSSRNRGLHAVSIGRAQDWSMWVVLEFGQALDRCRTLCDAQRRGHLAPDHRELWFRPEDVETVMTSTKRVVNLVDYGHVYRVLLAEATEHDPYSEGGQVAPS